MMRPIFSEGYFRPPEDAHAAFEITPSMGHKRIFVLSIRGVGAAAGYDPAAGYAAAFGPDSCISEGAPIWQTPALPGNARAPEIREGDSYWARPIAGRVVSNAEGRLWEVVGRELRPLNRIVRGPQGQMLELLPVPPPAETQKTEGDVIDGELIDESVGRTPEREEKMTAWRKADAQPAARAPRVRCRKLFAEPGLPRVVEFGKFRSALAPQLAHPERLRDLHRLACHVQIYEALAQQRADEFLEAMQCAGHRNIPVRPLTEEALAALGLSQFLARHPRPPQDAPREPGYVLSYECFYTMRVSSDPTAEATAQSVAGTSTPRNPSSDVNGSLAPAGSTPAAAPSLRRDIPERFQNPWEFQFRRDEVLYDMKVCAASSGSIGTLLRRMGGWFRRRKEFRKWRALLCAKNLDEQLWSVRPPAGAVAHPAVREWALQTLEGAGYDARSMLLEWEIFWRRKGV